MKFDVRVPGRGLSDSFSLTVHVANPVSYRTMQSRATTDDSIIGFVPAIHRGDKFQRYYPIHLSERNVKIPREDKMVDLAKHAIHNKVSENLLSAGGLGGHNITRLYDVTFYDLRFQLADPISAGTQLKRTAAKGLFGIIATIFR